MPISTTEIIDQIRCAAPPGQRRLDALTQARLVELTTALLAARPDSVDELDRYLGTRHRGISVPLSRMTAAVRDRTVVVTGGSGCIGTALLEQLSALAPCRLLSVAIGRPLRPVAGVDYVHLDIRRADELNRFFSRHRPDIVFHLAAQRDPGLAEREVAATLSTNVIGTGNVAAAAERSGVHRLVYASTGKAVRPYTTDVYAGSKRIGEWFMATVAARGHVRCSGVRFTHVVDNSIILDRLQRWCARREVVRLHCSDALFYVQSARESAQLLLTALLAPPDDVFRLHVLRDLGWPVSPLDLALGMMIRTRVVPPLYFAGYDAGYERKPYPGLYDPMMAGDMSPLVNSIEAHSVEESACPSVDAVPVAALHAPDVKAGLSHLTGDCASFPGAGRRTLQQMGWQLLVETARVTSPLVLGRIVKLTEGHRSTMTEEHRAIDDVFRLWATQGEASCVAPNRHAAVGPPERDAVSTVGTAAVVDDLARLTWRP
jgi:NAD(P)-dependent dehydrogenase (short-subunit alcohol dehydrogenase family)